MRAHRRARRGSVQARLHAHHGVETSHGTSSIMRGPIAKCNQADSRRYNGRSRGNYAPVEVGRFPTGNSPYGVADMAGNVWEMTSTVFDSESHVMRGGSFLNADADVRTVVGWAARDEARGTNWLGSRCVMDTKGR